MKVVFRVDSGPTIGSGHLSRCIALADELTADITFVCSDQSLPAPYPTIYLTDELPLSDVLIIDHYKLGYEYEVSVRHTTKLIVVIDDLHRKHDCDIIIDPVQRSYADRTPPNTINLTGLDYILLSRAIISTPPKQPSTSLSRINVSFGGSDPNNMTQQVLSQLTGDYQIDVVLGGSYIHPITVGPNVQLHRNLSQSQYAQLLTRADLAIGGGGVSMYERMFLHVPSIVIPIVDNQLPGVQSIKTDWIKFDITLDLFTPVSKPPIDGLGAQRVSVVINHLLQRLITD